VTQVLAAQAMATLDSLALDGLALDGLALDKEFGTALGRGALAILAYAALGVVLLVAGYYAIDLATPGRLSTIIRTDRNPNATLLAACGVFAVALIVVAAIWSSGGRLVEGLLSTLVFGAVGIAAQVIASLIFDRLVGIETRGLVHEAQLQPATILLGTTHVAIGLVTAIAVI
jgi:uncharacterized membrane protein YjfL (UPF0719 family)